MKISENLLKLLENNIEIKNFLKGQTNFEFNLRRLSREDFERILTFYPNLLNLHPSDIIIYESENQIDNPSTSILCINIIKQDNSANNFMRLQKLKIYFNEKDEKILKILQK